MNNHHDFSPVVGRLVNGDVATFDHNAGRCAYFRTGAANFWMLGNQLEFFKEAVQQLVGCPFVFDGDMTPDFAQLVLREVTACS